MYGERERERERESERERERDREREGGGGECMNDLCSDEEYCYTLTHRLAPAPLQINCGYARTAIRELSASKRGNSRKQSDKHKRSREFQSIFAIPTYNLTGDLFTNHTNSLSRFDHLCERTLNT